MKPRPIRSKKTGEIVSYQLRYFLGRDENGKIKHAIRTWKPDKKYTPNQLEKELERQAILFEEEMKATEAKKWALNSTGSITFEAYSRKWIEEYSVPNHKIRTTESYESMLNRVNVAIGHIPLDSITPQIINAFLLNLREPGTKITDRKNASRLSDKSIKNYHTMLKSMFNTAVDWKMIKENPVDGVKAPKVRKKEVKALEKEDVIKLFDLLQEAPLKYNVFFQLAILSGMRRGEMLGLKWSCVDFEKCTITVKTTSLYSPKYGTYEDTPKTEGSERVIKISKSFFDLLALYKKEQEKAMIALGDQWHYTDYVFTKLDGTPMQPNLPYNWFMRFQKRHGLEHCSVHALRHTTATLLIMEGANVKLVSGRLGHSDTSTTTNIYASYLKSADEAAANALDEILGLNKNNKELPQRRRLKVKRMP